MKKRNIAAIGLVAMAMMIVSTACNEKEASFFGLSAQTATASCQNTFQVDGNEGDACHRVGKELAHRELVSRSTTRSLSDAQLARLANCESSGNPRAVSKSGTYHGLYQFNQRTWNGVASAVLPSYVGVKPSQAPPYVQDAMARALYKARGRSPWPVCGRRI